MIAAPPGKFGQPSRPWWSGRAPILCADDGCRGRSYRGDRLHGVSTTKPKRRPTQGWQLLMILREVIGVTRYFGHSAPSGDERRDRQRFIGCLLTAGIARRAFARASAAPASEDGDA